MCEPRKRSHQSAGRSMIHSDIIADDFISFSERAHWGGDAGRVHQMVDVSKLKEWVHLLSESESWEMGDSGFSH